MTEAKRVFCSHRSVDKPEVEDFARRLREAGIDAWFDLWEIAAGDDVIAKMNDGLSRCEVGLLFFSARESHGKWFPAEASSLTTQRIEDGKRIIPVVIGEGVEIPPLLRPLARRSIEDFQQILDAIRGVSSKPPLGPAATQPSVRQFHLRLTPSRHQSSQGALSLEAILDGQRVALHDDAVLSPRLRRSFAEFLQGRMKLVERSPEEARAHSLQRDLATLGEELGSALFAGEIGSKLRETLKGLGTASTLELTFASDDSVLLALPFEAARMDGAVVALNPSVRVLRRVLGAKSCVRHPPAAPLKVLVAVGAPDEGRTSNAALDLEHELQGVLDALEPRMRQGNADVRILEVGHPEEIRKALTRDEYHVLHLSGHGGAGTIELENEDGDPVPVSAKLLADTLKSSGRNVPIIFLSSCFGGLSTSDTTSMAVELVREGVPFVVAMQTRVTDQYASALAREFYAELAGPEHPHPTAALAAARRRLEEERVRAASRAAKPSDSQPEYATASLFVGVEEFPVVDYAADLRPLATSPVHRATGPLPNLTVGDLVGRRSELRTVLRVLRDHPASVAERGKRLGVVLTGIGGAGKSSVAGRAMARLAEDGWVVAAVSGAFRLDAIITAIAAELGRSDRPQLSKLGALLADSRMEERARLELVLKVLQTERVLLILDNFEDNLEAGGRQYLDANVSQWTALLASHAHTGKLLVTSRYPLPGLDLDLYHEPLGPLSAAQTRKLLWRLPALKSLSAEELAEVTRRIGGHPRMLEFLDGILRHGAARLPAVAKRLRDQARAAKVDLTSDVDNLDEAVRTTISLGTRDVLLDELLALAGDQIELGILVQCAASNLPISAEGVAHARSGSKPDAAQVHATRRALERWCELSLVTPLLSDHYWVHRWTAEAILARRGADDRKAAFERAAEYRLTRGGSGGLDLSDAVEAVENLLSADVHDDAATLALQITQFLLRAGQTIAVTSFASSVLTRIAIHTENFAPLADCEASANLSLGLSEAALRRYTALLAHHELLASHEPGRADYQRDLSVSCNKLGDLMLALGQVDEARAHFERSLAIRERLAQAEPGRADYQRDLVVSCIKLGDLMLALGEGDEARAHFERGLAIAECLAQAEPGRADYQRDLSVFCNKLGDLMLALGRGDEARAHFERSLAIAERLAQAEPARADYQRNLSVSCNELGDLMLGLGQVDEARAHFERSLAIRDRLAQAEPGRADYQRDLVVSLVRIAQLSRDEGAIQRAIDILYQLRNSGRLAPSDAGMIPAAESMRDQLVANGADPR